MTTQEILICTVIFILFVIMIIYYTKSKRKIAKFFFGTLSGIIALYPAQLLITSFGGTFEINLFTVTISAILGIPGVILMAILPLIKA